MPKTPCHSPDSLFDSEPLPDNKSATEMAGLLKLLQEKDQKIVLLEQRIQQLTEQFKLSQAHRFGKSSEKNASQLDMFNEAEDLDDQAQAENANEPELEKISYERKKRGKRQPLPADLPRVETIHDLSEDQKQCACGHELTEIDEERSEQLVLIPARAEVHVNVRKKYACLCCESRVATADLPPQPIPKSNAHPSSLAFIISRKFCDGMPLYRMEQELKRYKIELSRTTMARWVIRSSELLTPVYKALLKQIYCSNRIHCDETPLQVLKEKDRTAAQKSYMWVLAGYLDPSGNSLPDKIIPKQQKKLILFHYAPSRAGKVIRDLLGDYKGWLQSDDYAGYHQFDLSDVIETLRCMAHARRKFKEAEKIQGKSDKPGKAAMALGFMRKLYTIEKQIADETAEIRYQIRQKKSVPILEKMRTWLDKSIRTSLNKSKLGEALGYLNKNWKYLIRYCEDGYLEIDNNTAENTIRPFVIGRKNWLFSDTEAGAQSSAVLYSLTETAKACGHNPYDWLTQVLTELPKRLADHQAFDDLLPWNIAPDSLHKK